MILCIFIVILFSVFAISNIKWNFRTHGDANQLNCVLDRLLVASCLFLVILFSVLSP